MSLQQSIAIVALVLVLVEVAVPGVTPISDLLNSVVQSVSLGWFDFLP